MEREYNKASWSGDNIIRLKELMRQGCTVLDEIDVLKQGLSDTIKAVAEELEVKPSQLNRALKIAHKGTFTEEEDKFAEIDDLLSAAGRK